MNVANTNKNPRISSIDSLRGLSCLCVCLFHFQIQNTENIYNSVARYLDGGLYIFFLITGYIIPVTIFGVKSSWGNLGRFYGKRLLRLEPPYIVAIFALLIANILIAKLPFFQGKPIVVDWQNLLHHFLYLVPYFNEGWIIVVFWTLAIEFQYYMVIGFISIWLLPKISSEKRAVLFLACLFALQFAPIKLLFFTTLSYFCLGYGIFFWHKKIISQRIFFTISALLLAHIFFKNWHYGIFCVIGWFGIAYNYPRRKNFLTYLGLISYSLYLLHVPAKIKFENIIGRFISDPTIMMVLVAVGGLLVSVLVSYIFYLIIEKPSIHWTKKIKYRR